MGGSVDGLHTAFVNSPHHYENLVDPAFGYVGIGIVMNGPTIFVSEVFMQLMPVKAPVVTLPTTSPTTVPPATTTTTARPAPKPAAAPKPVLTPVKPPAPPSTTTSTTTTTTVPPAAPPAPEDETAPADPPRAPSPLLVSVLERLRTFDS
jgi:hypothetical protein